MHRAAPVLVFLVSAAVLAAQRTGSAADARLRIGRLVVQLDDLDRETWQAAMGELTDLGGAAVPLLAARVRMQPEPGAVDHGRVRAVQVLNRIGAAAVPAVRELLRVLPQAPTRLQSAIVLALGRIGPYTGAERKRIQEAMVDLVQGDAAVQKVSGQLREIIREHVQQYQEAFRTHARMGLDPEASVTELIAGLGDPNPFVREFAAELIGDPRRRDERALQTLAKMLGKPQPNQASMGDEFDSGGPALNLTVFYDRRIHNQVALAMVRMAPADPRSLPGYRFLLTRPRSEIRLEGLIALRRAGPLGAKLLPTLLPMVEREDRPVQREAITVLGMIGPDAAAAIPALTKLAEGNDRLLAALARAALRSIRE